MVESLETNSIPGGKGATAFGSPSAGAGGFGGTGEREGLGFNSYPGVLKTIALRLI
jgi:hypothetical protein